MKVQMLRQEIHCHLDLLLLTLTPGKERKEITVESPGVNVTSLWSDRDWISLVNQLYFLQSLVAPQQEEVRIQRLKI